MLRSVDACWRQKILSNCKSYRNESEPDSNCSDFEDFDKSTENGDLDVTSENITLNYTVRSSSHSHKTGYACAHCGYSFSTK